MIEDHKRTGLYYNAVQQNRQQFEGKVVLDVGTGSGILAIFAAHAGARKVYAVEATPMALNARKLVKANNVSCPDGDARAQGLPLGPQALLVLCLIQTPRHCVLVFPERKEKRKKRKEKLRKQRNSNQETS